MADRAGHDPRETRARNASVVSAARCSVALRPAISAKRTPRPSGMARRRASVPCLRCHVAGAQPAHPASRDLGKFLESHTGHAFLGGSWGWFAVLAVMFVLNTVLGEERLFRGYLLPRMNGAFGSGIGLQTACSSAPTTCTCRGLSQQAYLTGSSSLSVEALSQRADRHRGAQRAERRLHWTHTLARAERLSSVGPRAVNGPPKMAARSLRGRTALTALA